MTSCELRAGYCEDLLDGTCLAVLVLDYYGGKMTREFIPEVDINMLE